MRFPTSSLYIEGKQMMFKLTLPSLLSKGSVSLLVALVLGCGSQGSNGVAVDQLGIPTLPLSNPPDFFLIFTTQKTPSLLA